MSTYWVDLLGSEIRFIQGKYRTRAICAGSGKTIVLLHGTGGHAENFIRNIPAYAQHFRVVAIDMLWHGYSDLTDFSAEIFPPLLAHLSDVIDALKVDRIHLEGQSLGGWVAALFALKYPEKIERLILTTPMGYEPDPGTVEGYKQPDWAKLRDSNLATLADPNLANIRERMKRIIHNENTLTDEAVAVRHRIYNDPAVNAVQRKLMEAYFSGGIPEKFALRNSVIKNIKPQTLVYWGDKNITPVAVGRQMAANIPGARFHSAPETGHWAQFENSGEHNRVVLDFLTEGRAAAAS